MAIWPRRELNKEFIFAQQIFSSLHSGKAEPTAIKQATVDLVKYVGQMLGLARKEVYNLKPAVTHLTVSMLDPTHKKVGIVRIKTKDLLRIISGDIQPIDSAHLYEFK